jgi:drug/metabolite transporter (DMT)-like permease
MNRGKMAVAALLGLGGILQGFAFHRAHKEHSTQDRPVGYLLAILALFLDALRWVLLQKAFAKSAETSTASDCREEKDSPSADHATSQQSRLRMVAKVMFASLPVCFALAVACESEALAEAITNPLPVIALVVALSIGVLGINLAEFSVVHWTSAVTFNVLAQIHTIPLVLAGVLFFGDHIGAYKAVGFCICLVGAIQYSVIKSREDSKVMECESPTPANAQPPDLNSHELERTEACV